MSEIQQQIADGARPRARVGDVIAHGETIPDNVVRMTDSTDRADPDPWHWFRHDGGWRMGTSGRDASLGPLRTLDQLRGTFFSRWPMTVVEVDPEPQPAEPPEQKAERHQLNRPLGAAFDRLAAEARIAQAHNEDGVPLWIHLCGYVEAFPAIVLERRPDGGGCDRCDSGYPQRGDWRPLLAEASHRPPGPSKPTAEPGPLVLTLPEVPAEAVALVGVESLRRWTPSTSEVPSETGKWFSPSGGYCTWVRVLEIEGSVTVELAPPREPRTWPKLDPVPADVLRVRGASGSIWKRRATEGAWHNEDYSKVRSWGALALEDGPLTEVTP